MRDRKSISISRLDVVVLATSITMRSEQIDRWRMNERWLSNVWAPVRSTVWQVSFLGYDLGYFDRDQDRVEPGPSRRTEGAGTQRDVAFAPSSRPIHALRLPLVDRKIG